ncbi:MAG: T9SS type A sorting domain-containing protein [Chitinophagales bacterium]
MVEGDGTCLGNEVCKSVVLNTPTGINEIAYSKSLNVYPNPATSFIRVNANEVPNRIELFDVLGSLLKSETNLQQNNTIFINNLNTKIVLVKVYFEDGFAVKRIVID